MNKLKKLLAVLVCAAMTLTVGLTVCAEEMPANYWLEMYETYGGVPGGQEVTADGFVYAVYGDHATLIGYNGDGGDGIDIVLPQQVNGVPLTSIGSGDAGVFYGVDGIDSIVVPEGVTTLEGACFCWVNADKLYLPKSLKSVDFMAFWDSGMENIFYAGTEDEWNSLNVRELEGKTVSFNTPVPAAGAAVEGSAIPVADTVPDAVSVYVGGNLVTFDVEPRIMDGTTMLPVRQALEPLGAQFVWDGGSQTVTITQDSNTIVLTIGADTALVNGVAKTMLKPAMIIDGRTLIPIRFVSEELNYEVVWDEDTRSIYINKIVEAPEPVYEPLTPGHAYIPPHIGQ